MVECKDSADVTWELVFEDCSFNSHTETWDILLFWRWTLECPGECEPIEAYPDIYGMYGVCVPKGEVRGRKLIRKNLKQERRRDFTSSEKIELKACYKESKENFLICVSQLGYGWRDLVPPELLTTPPDNPAAAVCHCEMATAWKSNRNFRFHSLDPKDFINSTRRDSGHHNYKVEQAAEEIYWKSQIGKPPSTGINW
tara:strand:+ start:2607 stop:3200 length:594 start_codon:yes stop_codon:yes gene_type:complete